MAAKHDLSSMIPHFGVLAVAVALLTSSTGSKPATPDKKSTDPGAEDRVEAPAAPTTGQPDGAGHLRFLTQKKLYTPNPTSAVVGGAAAARLAPGTWVPGTLVVVVTVPDPTDSQFGFWFDQSVEAICQAAGHVGTLALDGYWYPWDLRRDRKEKPPRGPTGDPTLEPGVLLFRRFGEPLPTVVVLLVGENPVSGAHPGALGAALDLALPPGPGGTARLVAPYFSGSQASVTRAIRRRVEAHGTARFIVCSGAATSLDREKMLSDQTGPSDPAGGAGYELTIHSTQASNTRMVEAAVYYLHDLSNAGQPLPEHLPKEINFKQFAFLVESNSGFGEHALAALEKSSFGHEWANVRVLRFPMHIAKLTGIQSRERRERDERLGLAPKEGFRITFLDESRAGADLLPSADETRTALINKRLLDDYCAVLRRERVRYAGILATDPRDKIFLVEQLRRECPDVRPFVTGADLHFVHPEYKEAMEDALVVSTYPLYTPAQEWAKPTRDSLRLPFPSSNAEGIYNALLVVGAESHRKSNVEEVAARTAVAGGAARADELEGKMLDYRSPRWSGEESTRRPPIWISAVGGDARFVPLAYFPDAEDRIVYTAQSALSSGTRRADDPPYCPPLLGPLRVAMVILLIAAVYGIVVVRWTPTPPAGLPAATMILAIKGQCCTLIGVGVLCACLPFVLCFLPLALSFPQMWTEWKWIWLDAVLFIAVAITALAHAGLGLRFVVFQLWNFYRMPDGDREATRLGLSPQWPRVTSVAAAAISLGLIGLVVSAHLRGSTGAIYLFSERAAGLASEYSVVVPAVAMALGLSGCGVLGLRGLRTRVDRRVPCPYPESQDGAPTPASARVFGTFLRIRKKMDELDAHMTCLPRLAFDRRRQFGLVVLVAVGLAAYPFSRATPTWEGPAWDALFTAGFAALLGLAVVSGYRLYVLWRGVREILRGIVTIPMVGAFDRLPPKVARVFSHYLLFGRWRTADLQISLHLYDQIRTRVEQDKRTATLSQRLSPITTLISSTQTVRAAQAAGGKGSGDGNAAPHGKNGGGSHKPGKNGNKGNGKEKQNDFLPESPTSGPDLPEMTGADVKPLSDAAAVLITSLVAEWPDRTVADAFGTEDGRPASESQKPSGEGDKQTLRELAEQFVAIQVIVFLSQYFAQVRYLAFMTALAAGAILIAATDYAFQPERLIMYSAVGIAAVAAGLIGWVLYQINRNELVSRVARTAPDRFTLDGAFMSNCLAFVLPLVLVVAIQLSGRFRSIAEPILQIVR